MRPRRSVRLASRLTSYACAVSPSMTLSTRRLPFLRRVPASPVPRHPRYYEGATTSHSRIRSRLLVRFRGPRDLRLFVFALALPEGSETLPGRGLLLCRLPLIRLALRVDTNGISQV